MIRCFSVLCCQQKRYFKVCLYFSSNVPGLMCLFIGLHNYLLFLFCSYLNIFKKYIFSIMLYFMWNTKYDWLIYWLIDWWMNVSGVNVSRVFVALDTTDFHFMNKISWNILQTIPCRNREVRFRCAKNMYICKGMEEFWLLGNTKWEWGVGRVLRQGGRSRGRPICVFQGRYRLLQIK